MAAKRLNKRQLREQQELQELAVPEIAAPAPAAKESSPEPTAPAPTTQSIFSALGAEEEEEEVTEPESEPEAEQQVAKSSKKKNKKKKKKQPVDELKEEGTSTPKKNNSKEATNSNSSKDVSEMSVDEFDALLAQQAKLNAQSVATSGTNSTSAQSSKWISPLRTHLALDPRNLDPGVELRRQFGSAAIKAYQAEAGAAGRSASSGARARAQATNTNLKVRSILCTPKDYWSPIARSFTGMSMDVVEDDQVGRISTWLHSKAYRHVQMQFLQAVKSHDPNSLTALLRVYPYHIDTLLQLSDYSRHQGDLGQAGDFNDRALFAFERCASPSFIASLSSATSGPAMVNFHKIENRAFYLALHRQIGFLGRRGTWRTALEWSKLLLGLGQDGEDHHAALLWIDFLAIKSRQHRWLLELIDNLDEQKANRSGVRRIDHLSIPAVTPLDSANKVLAGESDSFSGAMDWCVGLQYARALALRAVEKEDGDKTHEKSTAALRLAIARYPGVVPLLCNKIGVDLPSKIAGHPLFSLETRYSASAAGETLPDLLTHIYVLRSESLWKESVYAQWLRATAVEVADVICADYDLGNKSKRKPALANTVSKLGVYRHVLVSDLPDTLRQQLIAFLPPAITKSSEQMDSFDPVPPRSTKSDSEVDRVTRYDDEYFAPVLADQASNRSRGNDSSEQQEGMMQALLRAFQGLGAAAPGQGLDEAMHNMDDETRADILAQLMDMQTTMPGAFDDDTPNNDDDTQQQDGPGAFYMLRNVFGGLFPGAPRNNDAQ